MTAILGFQALSPQNPQAVPPISSTLSFGCNCR
ncbi:hypothetical protein GA0070617_0736 [Micromonospora yangpuensis]|uniref:Uncharacterized protein n=1 Tax=Micromonospora yangpuensis TaxID=683228 RepID=A0A1C6U243_9ACTN|nr:hypothetical protein GA0070617_0736 [Micromonospora yangpuensis]